MNNINKMYFICLKFIFPLFILWLSAFLNFAWAKTQNVKSANKGLSLEIRLNAEKYKVGDLFTVEFFFKNYSKKMMRLPSYIWPYEANYLEIINTSSGKPLEKIYKVMFEFVPPGEKDLVEIQPNGSHRFVLKGEISRNELLDENDKKIKGIYAEFTNSAFLLSPPGKYSIQGLWKVHPKNFLNQASKKAWQGRLISKPVEFEVLEESMLEAAKHNSAIAIARAKLRTLNYKEENYALTIDEHKKRWKGIEGNFLAYNPTYKDILSKRQFIVVCFDRILKPEEIIEGGSGFILIDKDANKVIVVVPMK